VPTLAQSISAYIQKHRLLKPGHRVAVAVSGGADSVALLRLLLELRSALGIVLSVVHFNHMLRGEASDADEQFVAALARAHALEIHCAHGDVGRHSAQNHLSLETAAREMRYGFFSRLLREGTLERLATGHTLDDQAETVLLRLARGAGTRGLAGIYPQLSLAQPPSSQLSAISCQQNAAGIVRPLLSTPRSELEAYLTAIGQDWREDASNRDLRHARNRVRLEVLPSVESNLNPAIRQTLADTAEIARAEEDYWQDEVTRALARIAADMQPDGASVALPEFCALPLALRRRVLRQVSESLGLRLEFRHVEEILGIARGDAKSAQLPEGWTVSRKQHLLCFQPATAAKDSNYEYVLPVPGTVNIAELGTRVEAVLVSGGSRAGYNLENLLNPASLGRELRIRNWRAGDRFWPAHTRGPKKIKELLQEQRISGIERRLWPVATRGNNLVWVRGFAAPRQLRPGDESGEAVVIRESKA